MTSSQVHGTIDESRAGGAVLMLPMSASGWCMTSASSYGTSSSPFGARGYVSIPSDRRSLHPPAPAPVLFQDPPPSATRYSQVCFVRGSDTLCRLRLPPLREHLRAIASPSDTWSDPATSGPRPQGWSTSPMCHVAASYEPYGPKVTVSNRSDCLC